MRFTFGFDHYQFQVLPFGIALTPRMFTKTIVVTVRHLFIQGITIFPSINNWLLVTSSKDLLLQYLDTMIHLQSLRIAISFKKSDLVPSQRVLDSVYGQVDRTTEASPYQLSRTSCSNAGYSLLLSPCRGPLSRNHI